MVAFLKRAILTLYGKSEEDLQTEVRDQEERIEGRRQDRLRYLYELRRRSENARAEAQKKKARTQPKGQPKGRRDEK